MRISTVREFRDQATRMLRAKTPILVTRHGRLAGIFVPRPEVTLPIELKRQLYDMMSSDVARQLKRRRFQKRAERCRGVAEEAPCSSSQTLTSFSPPSSAVAPRSRFDMTTSSTS